MIYSSADQQSNNQMPKTMQSNENDKSASQSNSKLHRVVDSAKLFNTNILKILNLILQEFPKWLDAEYCYKFLRLTKERIDKVANHSENLKNFDYDYLRNASRLKEIMRLAFTQTAEVDPKIEELKNRLELSVPMLRHISGKYS